MKEIYDMLQKNGINCQIDSGKLIVYSAINMQGYRLIDPKIEVKQISFEKGYASRELALMEGIYKALAQLKPERAGKILFQDLQIAKDILRINQDSDGTYMIITSVMIADIYKNMDANQETRDKFLDAYSKEAAEYKNE
jgi:hypothetical protein